MHDDLLVFHDRIHRVCDAIFMDDIDIVCAGQRAHGRGVMDGSAGPTDRVSPWLDDDLNVHRSVAPIAIDVEQTDRAVARALYDEGACPSGDCRSGPRDPRFRRKIIHHGPDSSLDMDGVSG